MKWKDSVDMAGNEVQSGEEFLEEEQYSPWTEPGEKKGLRRINRPSLLMILLLLAIVALVAALLMLVWGGNGDMATRQAVNTLEDRVRELEERLDKYETIDEKVTSIWEQAKSFEKFKDRFDRSEASTSLRMDHLTVSLEALQKQMESVRKAPPAAAVQSESAEQASAKVRYHEVAPKETFYSISKKYDITIEQLLKLNQMNKNNVLKPGQKLIVGSTTE
jgi:LysM repeat protein